MGLAQGRLGLLAPGDVSHGADQAGRAAGSALALESGQSCASTQTVVRSGRSPGTRPNRAWMGWIESGFHRGPDARQIVWVQEF